MRPESTDRPTPGNGAPNAQSTTPPIEKKTVKRQEKLTPEVAAQTTTAYPTEPDTDGNGDMRYLIYTTPDGRKMKFRYYRTLKEWGLKGVRCYQCTDCFSIAHGRHSKTVHTTVDGKYFLMDPILANHVCLDPADTVVGQADGRPAPVVQGDEPESRDERDQSPEDGSQATPENEDDTTTHSGQEPNGNAGDAAVNVPPPLNAPPSSYSAVEPSASSSPVQDPFPLVQRALAELDPAFAGDIQYEILEFVHTELMPKFGRGPHKN